MMRWIAVLMMLFATPALAQPVTVAAVLEGAVDGAIRPGFAALHTETVALKAAVERLCSAPSEATLAAVRAHFADVVVAHSRVEFLRLGPLMEENRAERLLFWPDRKGIALRQVQQVLAEQDETATDAAGLRQKSVALQGLGALEFVLHGTGAEDLLGGAGNFRCRYGRAVAIALETVAGELDDAWAAEDGIAAELTGPTPESLVWRTETEAIEALTGVMSHGVEAIRDQRLLPFLGREGEDPKPRSALLWRSGLTVPSLRGNFEGIAALYEASRIGEATAEVDLWVGNGARFEFANARRATDAVTLPLEQALADETQRRALDYLVILSQSLQTLLGENLAAALGLSVGFSSLDGD